MPMRCGPGIHNGGFRLHPWSDHIPAHGTGSDADASIAAYALHLPRVREGVDIQDAVLFSKPDWGLDGCAISFDTLQVEISLTRKGSERVVMHGHACMLHIEGRSDVPAEDNASVRTTQEEGTNQPRRR
jgi:hypothetical protein